MLTIAIYSLIIAVVTQLYIITKMSNEYQELHKHYTRLHRLLDQVNDN